MNRSRVIASTPFLPRTRSMTRRSFRGLMRTPLAWARARSVSSCTRSLRVIRAAFTCAIVPYSLALRRLFRAGVAAEITRRGEFAQLVADHVFPDEHRHVLAAVVDGDRVADHVR